MAVSKKSATSKSKAAVEEALPTKEEALSAFSPALASGLERTRGLLLALKQNAPQLLHLEGGLVEQRFALALWWHALLNCETPKPDGAPCLACSNCLQSGAGLHADLLLLDGRADSIKIDDVRALRPVLGEPPRHARLRLVLLAEAHALTLESANSLLKVLEDPCPGTVFMFTVPQRERLLPTLISRGFVLTLPWPDPTRPLNPALAEWDAALAEFVRGGRGWFDKSAAKGAVDANLAQQIVLLGQKALAGRMADTDNANRPRLTQALQGLSDKGLLELDELFATCQEALQAHVNPALVLDYMATQMHLLARG